MSLAANLLRAEPGSHSGETNVWLTPRWLLEALGPFDLDPAACPGWQTAREHFYEADDGLHRDWSGFVWLNPPYGNGITAWVQRWAEHRNGILLVAARTENIWFRDAALASDLICFPSKRIKFLTSDGSAKGSPAFASVLFAAGGWAVERIRKIQGLHWKPEQSRAASRPSESKEGEEK